jgi:hypothetical protein
MLLVHNITRKACVNVEHQITNYTGVIMVYHTGVIILLLSYWSCCFGVITLVYHTGLIMQVYHTGVIILV